MGRRHGLALINIFDRDARLTDAVPAAYRGLDRFAAREKVVADLAAAGLLDRVEEHTLMVPHHDRSGVVIEPWLTDQWYCDARVLAAPALAAVEDGPHAVCAPPVGEHVFRLDAQDPALVHLPATLVGSSDTRLVRAGWGGVRRRDRGGRAATGARKIRRAGRAAP